MPAVNEPTGRRLFSPTTVQTLANGQGFGYAFGLTATGSTRADALQLQPYAINQVATTASSTGVVLPPATPGAMLMLSNDGANTLAVYALGNDTINGTAGATGVTQATTEAALYFCAAGGKWNRILTA